MAASTKYRIAEQVLYRIQGGRPDTASPVYLKDIMVAAGQVINKILKMQSFEKMQLGETIPDNLMIATYEGVAVTEYLDVSKALLPILPVSLPRNLGVLEIFDQHDPNNLFIPMLAGQANLLRSQVLINDLMGQIGYSPYGSRIVFTKNLPLYGVTTVTMRLVVFDISTYSDTTPLPIPSDYEAIIIEELVKQFAPIKAGEKLVDSYAEPQPQ